MHCYDEATDVDDNHDAIENPFVNNAFADDGHAYKEYE
jgi:hypothetical protein